VDRENAGSLTTHLLFPPSQVDWENAKTSELPGLKQIGIIYDRYIKCEKISVSEAGAAACNILHLPTPNKGGGKHALSYDDSRGAPLKVRKQGEPNSRFCRPLTNEQGNMVIAMCNKHGRPHSCKCRHSLTLRIQVTGGTQRAGL